METLAIRLTRSCLGALYFCAAVVQYNDPDPLRWIAIYGAAAIACWLPRRVAAGRALAAAAGVVALVWAASLAPRVLPAFEWGNLTRAMDPARPAIEESREMLGLTITALGMGFRWLLRPLRG